MAITKESDLWKSARNDRTGMFFGTVVPTVKCPHEFPISSIFDYLTFFMMLYLFDCWHNPVLFHTGWFVESFFTQTLIIHVIRTNKIPFWRRDVPCPTSVSDALSR